MPKSGCLSLFDALAGLSTSTLFPRITRSLPAPGNCPVFLCTENPQLGWGFRKAFSFEPVIQTPFDLLKHLAVWQLQVSN
ncbi:hypothetical protein ELX74_19755, partial [Escherichia coli]